MVMFLLNRSRVIVKNIRLTRPRYKSDSSGDKDSYGDKSDPPGNEGDFSRVKSENEHINSEITKEERDLTDLQIPLLCACDNPSEPTMYDCRKYSHNLPCHSAAPNFETLPYIPSGIFRCTYGEVLGRGANKNGYYRNPEYFSFHHMTFYDMHLMLRPYRQPSARTGRKP